MTLTPVLDISFLERRVGVFQKVLKVDLVGQNDSSIVDVWRLGHRIMRFVHPRLRDSLWHSWVIVVIYGFPIGNLPVHVSESTVLELLGGEFSSSILGTVLIWLSTCQISTVI